ncbi:MAG: cytochrome c biogenesis protein CcsA [Crocinitomicaceae bacterium]|nr:cytochrome c biogenesis protein CcsA [Crocinitomicaceae bacterium]
MKKIFDRIFSMPLMVLFLFLFFLSIGAATFVENDFGRDIAYKWVYKAGWFTFILFYLFLSLSYNIFKYKLLRWKKISSLLFHVAFLVIVLGALLTRYIGFEGVMAIREGEASNEIVSSETYLQVLVHNNDIQYKANVPVTIDTNDVAYVHEGTKGGNPLNWFANLFFSHNNYFEHNFTFEDTDVQISCLDVMKNPQDTLVVDPTGSAYLEVVTNGRQYNFLEAGQTRAFASGLKIGFNDTSYTDAIRVFETDSGLYAISPFDVTWMQMSDMTEGVLKRDSLQLFIQKRLYVIGNTQFMFNRYLKGGKIETMQSSRPNGLLGVKVKVEAGNEATEVVLIGGKGQDARPEYFQLAGINFKLGFGSIIKEVPFQLYLRDFQLERYPGTDNPSSFASEVTLIDPEKGLKEERRIFMNNVLDYGGYRFFQSSYDPDERGTILSVNKDRPGTILTYIGYILLGLGFFINLFSKNSRFQMLMRKAREIRVKRESMLGFIALLIVSGSSYSQEEFPVIDKDHAEKFSQVIIQDFGGRFEPVHTLANEILRKISREKEYEGQNAVQVFIGLNTIPGAWLQEPIIYVSGKSIRKKLNLDGKYAALLDFINPDFEYILKEDAEKAHRKRASERNEYDKDIIKTDERYNVLKGVLNGFYLRIFPKPNDSTNTWYAPVFLDGFKTQDSTLVIGMMKLYSNAVVEGLNTGNWEQADRVVDLISTYQVKTAPDELLPSERDIKWEITYNKLDIFKRLMTLYLLLGVCLLILNFIQIFVPKFDLKWPFKVGFWLLLLLWVMHGVGLGMRWYLSGHAPWSNGYEAVVFVGFVTVFAGLMFRKVKIIIGAVCILAWLMLFVAHMNQMDPEITQLVPVLKSYWLMIHVAVITGSYGFLGLGAILGLLILVMYLFISPDNVKRVMMTTRELTHITEMIITIGLFMLTIGTFLGGVWANESWGRYWGWDPKETWALASVLIYAVLVHLRFVPGLKSQFSFNALSLWAFSSIIMTFFGVNFYLSGLHSYAKGDPMPIPTWVPMTIGLLGVLTLVSWLKWRYAKKLAVGKQEMTDEE